MASSPAPPIDTQEQGAGERPPILRSAAAGLVSAAVALAIGELVAGISSKLSPPVISVGNRVVDAVPRPLKDFAIETFGTNDKLALLIGIYSFAAIFGLVLGILASRRFAIGAAGIGVFGAVGVWAAGGEVGSPWWAGAPSVIGALVGIVALATILAVTPHADHPAWFDGPHPDSSDTSGEPVPGILARRGFLQVGGAVVALGAVSAAGGRWLQGRFSAAASRLAVVLPKAKEPVEALAADTALDVEGISPFLTPNKDFYRIDTNLTVPQLAAEDWELKITGMVDEELTFSYEDILAMDLVEERITLTCVSNEVGGALVGTATWLGVPLEALLDQAGIDSKADQVVGRAFDGFTTGFPVDVLRDGRPSLLAVGMNGEALPLAHGFPARIVVPGLYGYVSATKWLTEIELTTFDQFDQYWVERDWSADGVIKTMARIDTPKGLQRVEAGKVRIGGVAWAQLRGIERVEVRVDDGEWAEAKLAAQDTTLTWRQWLHEVEVDAGTHSVEVRATDGKGDVQTEERARPFPDGASGWHRIQFLVN